MKRFTIIDKAFLLKRTPLFEELDLDLLLPIADKVTLAEFKAGEQIFNQNEEAHRLYFIVTGSVLIQDVSGATIAVLSEEDFFGDESIFNDKPREYSSLCHEDTLLMSLSRTNLLSIISECPSVAVGLLQVYTSTTPFRLRK